MAHPTHTCTIHFFSFVFFFFSFSFFFLFSFFFSTIFRLFFRLFSPCLFLGFELGVSSPCVGVGCCSVWYVGGGGWGGLLFAWNNKTVRRDWLLD